MTFCLPAFAKYVGIHPLAEVTCPLGGDELNTHFRFNRDGSFSQVVGLSYIYIYVVLVCSHQKQWLLYLRFLYGLMPSEKGKVKLFGLCKIQECRHL